MARGIALCVGVTEFRDTVYPPSMRDTVSCRTDADRFAATAQRAGFEVRIINNLDQVTWPNVEAAVFKAAEELSPGDHFVLMFSGHGIAAANGQFKQWCFFDQPIYRHGTFSIDSALKKFKQGTCVTLIVNSCFSGAGNGNGAQSALTPSPETIKLLDEKQSVRLAFRASAAGRGFNRVFGPTVKADVIEIDACGPAQVALDGTVASEPSPFICKFTTLVDEQIDANAFRNFSSFVQEIQGRSPADHRPERSPLLPPVSPAFEALGPVHLP